jgi:hypothetical protein
MGREFVHHLPISLYFSEDLAEISLENIKSRVLSYKDPQIYEPPRSTPHI